MTQNRFKKYESDDISVGYDLKRCIHAQRCVHGSTMVFDPDRRPWIKPDEASANEVAQIVAECPTGALVFERLDGGATEATPSENVVIVSASGPLYVRGNLKIMLADGEHTEFRQALCRCGASQNKPYCDNAHDDVGFDASGDVTDNRGETSGQATDGPLTITLAENGPLLLQGNVEIRSQDGKSIFRGTKGALCRCGASQNKPFCDGQHAVVGFDSGE